MITGSFSRIPKLNYYKFVENFIPSMPIFFHQIITLYINYNSRSVWYSLLAHWDGENLVNKYNK